MGNNSLVFRFDDVEVREREFTLTKAGKLVAIEPKAFRALVFLLRNPQRLISKEELLNSLWGDAVVMEGSLTRCIWLLRRLLEDDIREPRYIETVATIGYRFVCPVEVSEDGNYGSEAAFASAEIANGAIQTKPRSLTQWWVAGAAVFAIGIVFAVWTLRRPLPPPRISAYTQITHDGHEKSLRGTDGSRLYFTQGSPNAILQIGVNGGETAPVPVSLPGLFSDLKDISPDGSHALIGTTEEGYQGYPMWVVPILGGTATRLGYGLGESFSPDGASVIYSSDKGDIYTVRIDGTQNHKLASVGSVALFISWSPDGKAIRFTKDDKLWEMSSDGSGLHRLFPNWHEDDVQCCGRWTPDGHLYLFRLSNPSRPGSEIWVLREGNRLFGRRLSEPTRLTTGPMIWGLPVPSRDGKKIFAHGLIKGGELSRIDAKTGGTQPFMGGISAEFLSFSGDGKSVAYVSFPEAILWKANRDGSNRVRISEPPDLPVNPRWSPDSRQILFLSVKPDNHAAAYLVSADGGNPKKLLDGDSVDTGDANWSPDGSKVLFDWGGFLARFENRDLRILDLDSRKITIIPGSTGMFSSRWSPDGRYIAAFATPKTPYLQLFDFKTQRWSSLPTSGLLNAPIFSRDSRFVYFTLGDPQGVYRIPVSGGKQERVVDMTNWHLVGTFGFSMSLDPTDAPLLLRDISSNDIYALTLDQ